MGRGTHDDEGEPEALAVDGDRVEVAGDDAPLGVQAVVRLRGDGVRCADRGEGRGAEGLKGGGGGILF